MTMEFQCGWFTKAAINNLRAGEATEITIAARSADGGTTVVPLAFTPKAVKVWSFYNTAFGVQQGSSPSRGTYVTGVSTCSGFSDGTNEGCAAVSSRDWNKAVGSVTRCGQAMASAAILNIGDALAADTVVVLALGTLAFATNQFTVQWHWNDGVEALYFFAAFGGDIEANVFEWSTGHVGVASPFEEGPGILDSGLHETTKLVTLPFAPDFINTIGTGLGYNDGQNPPVAETNAQFFESMYVRGFTSLLHAIHDQSGYLVAQSRHIQGMGAIDMLPHLKAYNAALQLVFSVTWNYFPGGDPALTYMRGTVADLSGTSLRINYDSCTAQTPMRRYSLAIKGGSWRTHALVTPGTNTNQPVDNLGFTPIGLMAMTPSAGKSEGQAFGSVAQYGTVGPNVFGMGASDFTDAVAGVHMTSGYGGFPFAYCVSKNDKFAIIPPGNGAVMPAHKECGLPTRSAGAIELPWSSTTFTHSLIQLLLIGA